MRVLGLALAGVLPLAAPIAAHAVPLGSHLRQLVPASGITKISGRCFTAEALTPSPIRF